MFVCFYTVRKDHGTPKQLWAPDIYLHDVWEVFETYDDAVGRYLEITDDDTTHSAGVAKMDKHYRTDWME